jgi:hypothetical protein
MNTMAPPSKSLGKYHPSNFKNKSAIPTCPPVTKLENTKSSTTAQPGHSRQSSDIKRKLQQYQKDMFEQAASAGKLSVKHPEPQPPRLAPLGSPGPVTPWELEEEGGGYLVAGFKGMKPAANVKSPLVSPGLGLDVEGGKGRMSEAAEAVKKMIKLEEQKDEERGRQYSLGDDE